LQDDLRKANIRYDETQRELFSTTELYERVQRELRQSRETVRFVESERDEHVSTIERLRSDIKSKLVSIEEAESRVTDVSLRLDQSKRESTTKDDRIRDLENELNDFRNRYERSQEEHRSVLIVRDQYRDDLEEERRKATHETRELTTLQETLTRSETTLSSLRSEISISTERIKHVERERDDIREKNGHLDIDVHKLKERLSLLQGELRGITDARDRARKELEEFRRRYEEVTETITEVSPTPFHVEYVC
jgi:chromosome segregation ATPase